MYRMPEEYRASRKEWSVTSNAQKDRETRPPVLPRERRGTGLSRMVGARAALEEMQNGLCGFSFPTSPH